MKSVNEIGVNYNGVDERVLKIDTFGNLLLTEDFEPGFKNYISNAISSGMVKADELAYMTETVEDVAYIPVKKGTRSLYPVNYCLFLYWGLD